MILEQGTTQMLCHKHTNVCFRQATALNQVAEIRLCASRNSGNLIGCLVLTAPLDSLSQNKSLFFPSPSPDHLQLHALCF